MKKSFISILSVSLILLSVNVQAKNPFKEIQTNDGVKFSYKWKNEKMCKKDSPLVFVVKILNTNDYQTEVKYTVDYYFKTVRKASSEEQTFCVKANNALIGKIKKLGFDQAGLSNEQLMSDDFIVEFSGIQVTKSPDCNL